MNKFKKILKFLSSVLFYSVVLILVIIFLMFAAYFIDQKLGAKVGEVRSPLFGAYIIISESMIPSINVYDAVVTMRAAEEQIEVNDIITFLSKDIQTAGTPITHRVIGIVYDENEENVIGYRTKGDNNNTADFALIAPNEVIGKVMFRVPMIGYLQTFMTKPIGWILLIVIPCLLIIGSDIFKLVKSKQEQEESNKVEQINNITINSSGDFSSNNFDNNINDQVNNSINQYDNQNNNSVILPVTDSVVNGDINIISNSTNNINNNNSEDSEDNNLI